MGRNNELDYDRFVSGARDAEARRLVIDAANKQEADERLRDWQAEDHRRLVLWSSCKECSLEDSRIVETYSGDRVSVAEYKKKNIYARYSPDGRGVSASHDSFVAEFQ